MFCSTERHSCVRQNVELTVSPSKQQSFSGQSSLFNGGLGTFWLVAWFVDHDGMIATVITKPMNRKKTINGVLIP